MSHKCFIKILKSLTTFLIRSFPLLLTHEITPYNFGKQLKLLTVQRNLFNNNIKKAMEGWKDKLSSCLTHQQMLRKSPKNSWNSFNISVEKSINFKGSSHVRRKTHKTKKLIIFFFVVNESLRRKWDTSTHCCDFFFAHTKINILLMKEIKKRTTLYFLLLNLFILNGALST